MVKALVFVLVIILSSCSVSNSNNDVINVAISQEPSSLDVVVNTSLYSRIISVGNIFEKLLILDGEGKIRPELATFYSLSDDNKKLTFTLRDDVLFHNGEKMTEEDVALSMNRWLELYPKAKEIAQNGRFVVEGKNTVTIESENSLLFLPYLIASAPQEAIIVPSSSIGEDIVLSSIVGSGPYKLKEWISGEKIVLERFDSYSEYGENSNGKWGKKKAIENITYYFVPDSVTRLLGLETGLYDAINDVMSTDRARIENNSNLILLDGDESGSIALVFNKKEGSAKDIEIREAIALSLDSKTLMEACYGKYGYSLHSDYMEAWQGDWIVSSSDPYSGLDIERAKKLIEGKENLKIRILTSNLSNLDKIAVAAKEELEKVGFSVELIVLDWASFIETRKNSSEWDIYISAFTSVPLPQMKSYLSPSFPGYIEEESSAYLSIKEMNNASSLEEAKEMWQMCQQQLYNYLPCYLPGHYTTSYAYSKKLDNIITQNGFFFWATNKSDN